jgi:hypothetical protein
MNEKTIEFLTESQPLTDVIAAEFDVVIEAVTEIE